MTILLFLTPMWIGLAAYVVPLQIGAGPAAVTPGCWRPVSGSTWSVAACSSPPSSWARSTAARSSPRAHRRPHIAGGANDATNLWIVSLAVISIGFLLASASLFTTIVTLRTEGMTMRAAPGVHLVRHWWPRR